MLAACFVAGYPKPCRQVMQVDSTLRAIAMLSPGTAPTRAPYDTLSQQCLELGFRFTHLAFPRKSQPV